MVTEANGILIVVAIILGIIACFVFVDRLNTRRLERERLRLLTTVTQPHRGMRAERELVLKLLKNGTHPKAIFHDLYIKNRNGTFSQIDLVVAAPVGILVFEVKDYSGWIFGKGNQKQWTQVLAYSEKKNRFYNPVMQNDTHIKNLQKQLKQFENIPFFSIIVFYGNSVFRDVSCIPNDTLLIKPHQVIEAINFIATNNQPARYTNKREVSNLLQQAVLNGADKEIQIRHIENINDMLWRR